MTTRRLSSTGDSYSHDLVKDPMVTIARLPLVYHPRSSSRVNHSELPHRDDLQRMELAFREQPFADRDMTEFLRNSLYSAMTIVMFFTAAALTIGALVPPEWFWIPGVIGTGIVITLLWMSRRITPARAIGAVILPTLALYLCKGLWMAIDSRFIATAILSGICFVIVWRGVKHIVSFYFEWLYTDRRHRRTGSVVLTSAAPDRRADDVFGGACTRGGCRSPPRGTSKKDKRPLGSLVSAVLNRGLRPRPTISTCPCRIEA